MAQAPLGEVADGVAANELAPHKLPPQRIHHLIIITAVTAVLLTIVRLAIPLDWIIRSNPAAAGFQLGLLMIYCIGIACAGFALHWWWKGLPAFRQPGQWLLLVFPATAVGMFVLYVLSALSNPIGNERHYFFFYAGFTLAVPAFYYGYGAWRIADTHLWRIFFAVMAIGSLLQLLLFVDSMFFQSGIVFSMLRGSLWVYTLLPNAISFLLLALAMVADTQKRKRHWSHWAGAGLVASARLFNLSAAIWMFMAPQLVLP
jgi:hypothetical protein